MQQHSNPLNILMAGDNESAATAISYVLRRPAPKRFAVLSYSGGRCGKRETGMLKRCA
jgi:hypothetical protein